MSQESSPAPGRRRALNTWLAQQAQTIKNVVATVVNEVNEAINPTDKIECKYCGKKFKEKGIARHMSACKKTSK